MPDYEKVTIQTEGIAVSIPVEQLIAPIGEEYTSYQEEYFDLYETVGSQKDDLLDCRAIWLCPDFEWILGEYNGVKVLVPYKP
jgi:hypothetical protein